LLRSPNRAPHRRLERFDFCQIRHGPTLYRSYQFWTFTNKTVIVPCADSALSSRK
jgi:hypothetical protein